eukprot:CAMPEP_0167773358 /NCGR_PEP_ID=MMETSP0111_2-20121227/1374_1 /TAXON_ID=91324 /ORGANISM="Lotharella globosa, Strain CCCM811" /LENGTH=576 /DNA_ID=CAMNT_0007662983 /DNA_START=84 /DNA_END=1814 /DNA_ORIENTATION=+
MTASNWHRPIIVLDYPMKVRKGDVIQVHTKYLGKKDFTAEYEFKVEVCHDFKVLEWQKATVEYHKDIRPSYQVRGQKKTNITEYDGQGAMFKSTVDHSYSHRKPKKPKASSGAKKKTTKPSKKRLKPKDDGAPDHNGVARGTKKKRKYNKKGRTTLASSAPHKRKRAHDGEDTEGESEAGRGGETKRYNGWPGVVTITVRDYWGHGGEKVETLQSDSGSSDRKDAGASSSSYPLLLKGKLANEIHAFLNDAKAVEETIQCLCGTKAAKAIPVHNADESGVEASGAPNNSESHQDISQGNTGVEASNGPDNIEDLQDITQGYTKLRAPDKSEGAEDITGVGTSDEKSGRLQDITQGCNGVENSGAPDKMETLGDVTQGYTAYGTSGAPDNRESLQDISDVAAFGSPGNSKRFQDITEIENRMSQHKAEGGSSMNEEEQEKYRRGLRLERQMHELNSMVKTRLLRPYFQNFTSLLVMDAVQKAKNILQRLAPPSPTVEEKTAQTEKENLEEKPETAPSHDWANDEKLGRLADYVTGQVSTRMTEQIHKIREHYNRNPPKKPQLKKKTTESPKVKLVRG